MSYQSKYELYDQLWYDYIRHKNDVENSFMYKHCKSKKDDRAESLSHDKETLYGYKHKRHDKYTLLRGAYLAMNNNVIKQTEYEEIFMELAGSESGGNTYEKLFAENAQKAQSEFEIKLLKGSVGDWFFNAGYRMSNNGKNSKNGRRKSDGNIDDVEIAFRFAAYDNSSSEKNPGKGVEITDEYIEKCRGLYSAALESKAEDAFIPLLFDSSSGAGIYIIGKHNAPTLKGKSCAVFVLRFGWFNIENADDDWQTFKMPVGLDEFEEDKDVPLILDGWVGREMPLIMLAKECTGIGDAFNRFSSERNGDFYFEGFADTNEEISLDGVDNCFIRLLRKGKEFKKLREEMQDERDRRIIEQQSIKEDMDKRRYKAAEDTNRAAQQK